MIFEIKLNRKFWIPKIDKNLRGHTKRIKEF